MRNTLYSVIAWLGILSLGAAPLVESARTVPLIQDVDVLVVGGSTGAVAAAEAAARNGAAVFLVTDYPCLGEDMAGTLRVWASRAEADSSDLMRAMFDLAAEGDTLYTTPLRIKKTLDRALLQANVRFLTGMYATDVLTDAKGEVAGVVVANRSGRQAIRAKVVIDATGRGALARRAGAEVTPFPAGTYTVSRVVVGSVIPPNSGTRDWQPPDSVRHENWRPDEDLVQLSRTTRISPALYECTLDIAFADGSTRAFQEAEQVARDRTFVRAQLDAADRLFFIPPDQIKAERSVTDETATAASLDLAALRPVGIPHLHVLGPLADVPRPVATALARPANAIRLGQRLGEQAAADARQRPAVGDVQRPGTATGTPADIREIQGMLTKTYVAAAGSVPYAAGDLPILAETDLLVVGGGTTGAPAAIGAVRNGVKTLVVEYLHELGGVQTAGMITGYYYGFQRGFTKEIDEAVKATGWVRSQAKAEWYRRAIREGGGEIWFGSLAVGAYREGNQLRGVVVATPDGQRGIVLAKAVIDATGNADIAAAAGEPTEFYLEQELIGQAVGMAVLRLGAGGHNNDFSMVDDTDAADLSFFALRHRQMTDGGWDVSQLVNSRERRRMVGVYQISVLDYLTARTYPDTINQHRSRFDLHGQASHDLLLTKNIRTANHVTLEANAPYRALLPQTTDGLLVVALGMSATRDAMAILRMQPDLQNQGYAAAYAVHLALRDGCALRDIPVPELQRHLVEKGNLPASVLDARDSHPVSDEMLKLATHDLMFNYGNLAFLFAEPERAKPYLQERYRELSTHSSGRSPEVSLVYAHVLAMLGDPVGEDELIAWIEANEWTAKWDAGRDAGGNRMSAYILALGRAGSRKAIPAIAAKARENCQDGKRAPSPNVARILALTAQALRDPALAEVLAMMLDCPGVSGHSFRLAADIPPVPGYDSRSNYSHGEKNAVAREMNLACALYRLGDHEGKAAAILQAYADDPRGFYANYARLVLAETAK
ncbi:MAG: FAD-dependent oxidoreductase [Lentisphaeria bacterium]|nr:FAD-dependent oxidoreductase [Lentisphaeria bacterium]